MIVRQLSKAYGFLWALKDVNVEFQSGERIALLGPNGAGKTTFLRLLSALLYPTSGQIELDGQKIRLGSSRLRSAVGLLSPGEHFYENLTLKENLRLFNALYGTGKDLHDIEHSLDTVGLLGCSNEYVASLSSGMKCRLAIAKWQLLEPRLLLLDEPYGVLDGNGVDLLESYLERLCIHGGIVVIATHHVPRIATFCSRAVVLNKGRIIFDEPRREPWESLHRVFGGFLPRGEKWNF
ncbi:MAG: heme ABC exporter ATP-binding protein CcmA [Candidatus Binatia bacterium]